MSSTSNVQNLLTNVFRPVFTYDTTNGVYQTKLELTNIDSISANTVYGFTAAFGDSSGNVYIGIGSGNAYSALATTSNSCNTFIGMYAGGSTSIVKNGVFLGYRAGFGAALSSNSISIGANSSNGGNSNIYIGCGTGITSGSNNIFLGAGLSNGGNAISNCFVLGSGSNTTIAGDLLNKRIGINITPSNFISNTTTVPISLDVNGYTRIGTSNNGGLGINIAPESYALDVNGEMRVTNGYGSFKFERSGSNTIASISNTDTYPNASALLQVTGGFRSLSGTTTSISPSGTSNIGLWKRGVVMIFSEDTLGSSFTFNLFFVRSTTGSTFIVSLNSGTSNGMSITASTSNIVLTNTTVGSQIFRYSITYFPTP